MTGTLPSEQRAVLGIARVLLSPSDGLTVQGCVWAPPMNADSPPCLWRRGRLRVFNRVDTGLPALLERTRHRNERKLQFQGLTDL